MNKHESPKTFRRQFTEMWLYYFLSALALMLALTYTESRPQHFQKCDNEGVHCVR